MQIKPKLTKTTFLDSFKATKFMNNSHVRVSAKPLKRKADARGPISEEGEASR